MTNDELYRRLYTLRDQLKVELSSNGRAPTICTDDALQELAAHPPRQKADLVGIEGLGETFANKYGDFFMPVIKEFFADGVQSSKMSKKLRETLKSLENRLVNISRKNRLLYIGRLSSKTAMDLYDKSKDYNQSVIDLILGRKSQITLCQMKLRDDWESDDKRFKKALQLIREVSKEARETGQHDLYIGYPYVMGNTYGEDFTIRAPLVLFPVTFDKKPDTITIKRDMSKDILYNSNLILTQLKFLNKADDLPNTTVEQIFTDTFIADTLKFYSENNFKIEGELGPLEKFEDLGLKDFPKYRKGEYHLVGNAILGRFSTYSTALQKDYRELTKAEDINDLVDELLRDINDVDITKEPEEKITKPLPFSETNIHYINDLNSSQERAVFAMNNEDKLVIQGPPGTGKSQTITSLISDAVNKNQTVLMVSQKKAALDVIYSRLGYLSNFTILLNDMKDKNTFYKQLHTIFACNKEVSFDNKNYMYLAESIDANVSKCKTIANTLVGTKINNEPVLNLYADNVNNYWTHGDKTQELDYYYKIIPNKVLSIPYSEIKASREKLLSETVIADVVTHIGILKIYPWVAGMRTGLSEFDLRDMQRAFEEFKVSQEEYLKQGFFAKLLGKGRRKRALKKAMKPYFSNKKYMSYLFKHPSSLLESTAYATDYQRTLDRYKALNKCDIIFADTVFKLMQESTSDTGHDPLSTAKKLYDFYIYYLLTNFESKNTTTMNTISDFSTLITDTMSKMSDKKDLTKDKVKEILSSAFYSEILSSKRYLEICRQIQSQRKWSIAKFVGKFSYELLSGIKVWLMTPETVSEVLPLANGLFDLLIFDEASQIYIEKGIPSIVRAKKVVVAGDHKQLRPSSLGFGRIDVEDEDNLEEDSEVSAALEEESLLDLARFKYPSVLLNYHYRAKYEELINFSNYAFYDARLNVSPNTEELENPPIEVIKVKDGKWLGRKNKKEAERVVALIKEVLFNRKNKETVGVITFNTNQREAILDEIDRECLKDETFSALYKKELDRKDNGEDIGIFVKNIENVQGDERDHIIFSTGYARNEEGKVVRNFGWLNQQGGENRLNVAISRAKRKITIVTSILPEELPVDDLKNDGPKLFRKYLEYCWAVSKKDTASVKRILTSLVDTTSNPEEKTLTPMVSEIISSLKEKGINAEAQVGLGNYKVDIALKDSTNTRYILGIELDSSLYLSNLDDRERDIFKKQYLECRGWRIYRLWSKNWWRNRDAEIDNIVKIYNLLTK